MGHEGGLLLCTWPQGGGFPFLLCIATKIWTGVEYQAHPISFPGRVKEGLDIGAPPQPV